MKDADLPIELISNIYEEFLDKKTRIVYTPPYLVSLLVDELLPLSDYEKSVLKVLESACGSGFQKPFQQQRFQMKKA